MYQEGEWVVREALSLALKGWPVTLEGVVMAKVQQGLAEQVLVILVAEVGEVLEGVS
jgi:hypothetical protein